MLSTEQTKWLLCLVLLAPPGLQSQPVEPDEARKLDRIVVEAARLRHAEGFDLPASVDAVEIDHDDNRTGIVASEALAGLPGVLARDRRNFAQDTQLSIRGFGARSTFGVRGICLYTDGIPATMPDGQGQLSHFDLPAGERVEIVRGPFSALHGNSSGGVVQLWSADGQSGDPWRVRTSAGSGDAFSATTQALGGGARGGYNMALSHLRTDGPREHSAARRNAAHLKLRIELDPARRLDLIGNLLDLRDAQDPLGLNLDEFRQDSTQATPAATTFNTRKSVRQRQVGAIYEHSIDKRQVLRAMAYAGHRDVEQYLAVPVAAQGNPLHAGGVIDIDNDYGGVDLRWSWSNTLADAPIEVTLGANIDRLRQQRQGFENFVGNQLGVRGALRRDECNTTGNADQFAQVWWRFSPRWSLLAGVRRSDIGFRSSDRYVTGNNPDDSGRIDYDEISPVFGLAFAPSDGARLYLSAGRGFETPTFNELSYRADGGAGLAFDLQPAISNNVEAGFKWRGGSETEVGIALFRADTDDEIAVARNVAGRSSFRNIGRARRQGVEAAWSASFGEYWHARMAYTRLDATFRSPFLTCVAAGCTNPSLTVPAGARIPGVPRQQAFARLQWRAGGWTAGIELEAIDDVVVNDIASESASGHALAHVETSRSWRLPHGELRGFARIDNVFDRMHAGSVIVNEGNGRFYEPGPGRTWLIGIEWRWQP
jgi:iron complex outermembrane receptor protein